MSVSHPTFSYLKPRLCAKPGTMPKGLVIDSNILVRAAWGNRVRAILEQFRDRATFSAPSVCRSDARRRIPEICRKNDLEQNVALGFLNDVEKVVRFPELTYYGFRERDARERIQARDPDDWPVIATALALDLPIWTEDRDFFGCGVATWITNTVEIYLRG